MIVASPLWLKQYIFGKYLKLNCHIDQLECDEHLLLYKLKQPFIKFDWISPTVQVTWDLEAIRLTGLKPTLQNSHGMSGKTLLDVNGWRQLREL